MANPIAPKERALQHAAHLADHVKILTTLARVVSGLPVHVVGAREDLGVRGLELRVPESLATAQTHQGNRRLYRNRIVLLAALARDRRSLPADPFSRAIEEQARFRDALGWLQTELPSFDVTTAGNAWGHLHDVPESDESTGDPPTAPIGIEAHRIDVGVPDGDEAAIAYDEWDSRKKAYRKDWCTVIPGTLAVQSAAWGLEARGRHSTTIEHLRHQLEDQRTERRHVTRRHDGDERDLDALIEHLADVRAGHEGAGRSHIRALPRRRDTATTVLLDLSLSSDSLIDDRRVLDVSREAILVLGEVADALHDRLEVLAFSSATRHCCHVWTLKAWEDSWPLCRDRLGALEPQGHPRIGAAIRHATAGLARTVAEARVLLVVGDGKPTDLDRYEGRYGQGDIGRALQEALRLGINVHAVAVDRMVRHTVPAMLEPGRAHFVSHAAELMPALTKVYGDLTRG